MGEFYSDYFLLYFGFAFFFFLSLLTIKSVGIEDPIYVKSIWIVAAFVFLAIGWNGPYDFDYFLVLFSVLLPLISLYFSSPPFLPPKKITRKFIFFLSLLSFFGIVVNISDLFLNFEPEGIFSDYANNELRFPETKFAFFALRIACIPTLALSDSFKLKNLKSLSVIWLITELINTLIYPSKGTLLYLFFYYLYFLFWKKVFSPNHFKLKTILNFRKFAVKKSSLSGILKFFIPSLILFFLGIFLFSFLGEIDLISSIKIISYRLFNMSLQLSFDLIKDQDIVIGLNNVRSEFSSILELWFKAYLTNIFDFNYINDTIPKYFYAISDTDVGFSVGVFSPNSNLLLEVFLIHGRFYGLFIFSLIILLGSSIRKIFLIKEIIDIKTYVFIPIIAYGPLFCISDGQAFFTSYSLYIAILIFLALFVEVVYYLKRINQ